MRALLLLSLNWLLATSLIGQPISLTLQPDFFTFGSQITRTANGKYIIGGEMGQIPSYPYLRPYLAMIDTAGIVLWEKELLEVWAIERGMVTSLEVSPVNGDIFVTTFNSGCDYGLPGALYCFDQEGTQKWFVELSISTPQNLNFFSNGNMVISDYQFEGIQCFSPEGDLLWTIENSGPFSIIGGLAINDEDELLAFTSITRYVIDSTGSIVTILTDPGIDYATNWTNHGVLTLKGSVVRLFPNGGGDPIEVDLSDLGNIFNVHPHENGIYLLVNNEDAQVKMIQLDDQLTVVETFSFQDPYLSPQDLEVIDNQIIVVGNEYPEPLYSNDAFLIGFHPFYLFGWPFLHKGGQLFLQSYTLDEPNEGTFDVSIAEMIYNNPPETQPAEFGCNSGPAFHLNLSNHQIKIANLGTTVIDQLNINARYEPCYWICNGASTQQIPFDNLNLQPGESVILDLPDHNFSNLIYTSQLEVCYWVSAPGQPVDIDHTNNIDCQTVMVTNTREIEAETVSLYPNPATREIWVDLPLDAQIENVTLINAAGRTIEVTPMQHAGRLTLNTEQLTPGIYWITIIGARKNWKGRFIKVRP